MPPGEVSAAIGKSVQIKGELQGNEDLLIDGLVDGTIALLDSRLTIGPNARVKANVTARDIVVMGLLHGNLHATGRVELRAGSQVVGDVRAARLSIEENASYSGKVDLLQTGDEKPRSASAAGSAQPTAAAAGTGQAAATKPLF